MLYPVLGAVVGFLLAFVLPTILVWRSLRIAKQSLGTQVLVCVSPIVLLAGAFTMANMHVGTATYVLAAVLGGFAYIGPWLLWFALKASRSAEPISLWLTSNNDGR
jgi:hypothetical protein